MRRMRSTGRRCFKGLWWYSEEAGYWQGGSPSREDEIGGTGYRVYSKDEIGGTSRVVLLLRWFSYLILLRRYWEGGSPGGTPT